MREISIIKKNILQFLEYKNVSKYEFYHKTGISNGILSQSNGISEDNILKLISYYTELNPEWLLTGVGTMLKKKQYDLPREEISIVNEPVEVYGAEILKERIKLQEDTIKFLREKIVDLEAKLNNEVSEKKLLADIKKIN